MRLTHSYVYFIGAKIYRAVYFKRTVLQGYSPQFKEKRRLPSHYAAVLRL